MRSLALILLLTFPLLSLADIETTVDQVISVFENGTTDVQYHYIENIHDGRGFTAGKVGFTSGTGDMWQVVEAYSHKKPNSKLTPLVSILKQLAGDESGEIKDLNALPQAWMEECKDPEFRKTQDELVDSFYKKPARAYLKKFNFSSPLAYLVFYDSIIQHGDGNEPDSFAGILKKMKIQPKAEKEFLMEFLKTRREILINPANKETQAEWSKSVDRTEALAKLIQDGNWDLKVPFTLRVWNENFTVK